MAGTKLTLTQEQLKSVADPPRRYLGSSEIGTCPRKAQYWMLYRRAYYNKDDISLAKATREGKSPYGGPIPEFIPDAAAQAKMKRGTLLEPLVIEMLEARGFVLGSTGRDQAEVQAGGIKGHPDGIILETPDDMPDYDGWLLEVKTTAPYSLFGRKDSARGKGWGGVIGNTDYAGRGPQEYYKDQVTVYMQHWDCPGTLFAYLNVVDGDIWLVPYRVEPGRLGTLTRKAAKIMNFGKLPDKEPAGSWECKTCVFRARCKKDG